MKGFAFAAACAGFVVALGGTAIAQNAASLSMSALLSPNAAPQTITSKMGFLVYEAQSTSRSAQLDAVNQIKGILSKGAALSAGERTAFYEALAAAALSGTGTRAMSGSVVVNDFPLVRMEAVHEMGVLGGKNAVAVLLRVLKEDNDPTVLAEAAYELGRLKQNPGNSVSNAIVAALRHVPQRHADGIFAYTAMRALGQLAQANPGHPDRSVFSVIEDIGQMGYGPRVDRAATAALQSAITYG